MSNDNTAQSLSMEYILGKIEQIASDTTYLSEAIAALQDLKPDHRFADNPEGDNASTAKAQALGSVVKCRETTNQQILALYTRMYQDLNDPSENEDMRKLAQLRQITEIFKDASVPSLPFVQELAEKILGLPTDD